MREFFTALYGAVLFTSFIRRTSLLLPWIETIPSCTQRKGSRQRDRALPNDARGLKKFVTRHSYASGKDLDEMDAFGTEAPLR